MENLNKLTKGQVQVILKAMYEKGQRENNVNVKDFILEIKQRVILVLYSAK